MRELKMDIVMSPVCPSLIEDYSGPSLTRQLGHTNLPLRGIFSGMNLWIPLPGQLLDIISSFPDETYSYIWNPLLSSSGTSEDFACPFIPSEFSPDIFLLCRLLFSKSLH